MTERHDHQGQTAIEKLDTVFKGMSMAFLNKLNAWKSGAGYTFHDKTSSFFAWWRRFPEPLTLLDRLKSHHPDSFGHSVNVSLLTALQAQRAGLPSDEVREAAFAGLLHDVGKIAVPVDVLDKQDKLTRQEAARISVHSVAGARALAAIPDLPRLVVVSAYEHHLHFDGKGGYPRPTRCHPPHAVSQMVALGDFFDALTTVKPYRQAQPRDRVLQMMKEREGRFFHPVLLQQFLQLISSLN